MLTQLTPRQQAALNASTANGRLAPFRRTYSGHEGPAAELYLLDAKLASHIHAHLRIVEVVLRQQMHVALKGSYGARWFDSRTGANLSSEASKKVRDAYDTLNPQRQRRAASPQGQKPSADKVVAALMLGFWVALLRTPNDADHQATLWTPALEACFNVNRIAGTPIWTMSKSQKTCQRLNWARNRVNHCESVVFGFPQPGQTQHGQIRYSPKSIVDECRTLVGRFDPSIEAWMRTCTVVDHLIADPAAQRALAYSAGQQGRTIR